MSQANVDPRILELAKKVKGRRARIVIDHIIKHGFITTEDLQNTYRYNHPPRAIGDVRDAGIPIETYSVTSQDGRTIAAYRFGDPSKLVGDVLGGRRNFPKSLKRDLVEQNDGVCAITGVRFESRYLQIDHRIPFRVAGDHYAGRADPADYMLLSSAAQRQKSWSCEHCDNFKKILNPDICRVCYWASPQDYEHVAMTNARRVEVVWSGEAGVADYERASAMADAEGMTMQDFIKRVLKRLRKSIK